MEKSFKIPLAIYEEVYKMIKKKIDTSIYKPSNLSYCCYTANKFSMKM